MTASKVSTPFYIQYLTENGEYRTQEGVWMNNGEVWIYICELPEYY